MIKQRTTNKEDKRKYKEMASEYKAIRGIFQSMINKIEEQQAKISGIYT